MKQVKLYIIDNSEAFKNQLEDLLFNQDWKIKVYGKAVNRMEVKEDLANASRADVFLISASLPDVNGIHLMDYLKREVNPQATYLITVDKNTQNLADEALDKGAANYFVKPVDPLYLRDVIYKEMGMEVKEEEAEEEEMLEYEEEVDVEELEFEEEEPFIEEEEEEEEEPPPPPPKKKKNRAKVSKREMFDTQTIRNSGFHNAYRDDDKPSRVITVTSPKSTGKTTAVVNLAASIKKNSEHQPSVVVLDLNLLFPSVIFKYKETELIYPEKNIYDVLDDIDELDERTLREALICHEPTGVYILNTPISAIRNIHKMNPKKLEKVILYLREAFDVVIIDTTGDIKDNETTVPLTMSDVNIVLFESDLVNLMHMDKFIELTRRMEKELEKNIIDNSYFVLNRYAENASLALETVRKFIYDIDNVGLNVPLYIPEERNMTRYSNKAKFVVDMENETGEKLNELASMVYPFYMENENELYRNGGEKVSWLGSIFKRK